MTRTSTISQLALLFLFIIPIKYIYAQCDSITWLNPAPLGNELSEIQFIDAQTGYVAGKALYKSSDGGNTWKEILRNKGGDISSFHFPNSSIGYAANTIGKIFKSSDAGVNWTTLSFQINEATNDVFFANKDTGFVATTNGIFMTVNGGVNWAITIGSTNTLVNEIHFVTPLKGFATAANGTVLRTSDGGKTWEKISTPSEKPFYAISFTDTLTGYLGGGFVAIGGISVGNIYKTTDGGKTWNDLNFSGTLVKDLNFFSGSEGIAITSDYYASHKGIIYKTNDGGQNWDIKDRTKALNSIHFTNAQVGFAAGINGTIRKTTNKGEAWDSLSGGISNHFRAQYWLDNKRGIVVSGDPCGRCAPYGVVFKTDDGGASWKTVLSGLSYKDVFFVDKKIGFVMGYHLMKTTDGGNTWTRVSGETASFTSLHFFNPNKGIATDIDGKVFQTTDGGTTWQEIYTSEQGSLEKITFLNSHIGFAVGSGGKILKTIDQGTSWVSLYPETSVLLEAIHFINPNIGYAAGDSVILKTTNGGQTWEKQVLPGKYISSIYFVNQDTGFATTKMGDILKTTDKGNTWKALPKATDHYLSSIVFTPNKTGIAVGDKGTILKFGCGSFEELVLPINAKENTSNDVFDVYPNPSHGSIYIQRTDKSLDEVRVLNSMGVEVLRHQIKDEEAPINTENLPDGIYYLEAITGGSKRKALKKIILN